MRAIVCVDRNWGIGKDNHLLFTLPEDMKRFKEATLNKTVVMGAATWQSLPKRPLKDRRNIVLDWNGISYEGAETAKSIKELDELFREIGYEDIIVIGGASVYKALLPYCQEILVTRVNATAEADRFFPNLDENPDFEVVYKSEEFVAQSGLSYQFLTYRRMSKWQQN